MAKQDYETTQPPKVPSHFEGKKEADVVKADDTKGVEFPYKNHKDRIISYDYYMRIFLGQHYEAFGAFIDNDQYNKNYGKLRYVMVNFAGLISKIIADMLFSEPIKINVPDGDQGFVDALVYENNLHTQLYENALTNSALGDGLFKLRVGPRREGDKSTVIIEDTTPTIYYPTIDGYNVRAEPTAQELAWIVQVDDKTKYLRREIHSAGLIQNKVNKMEGNKIGAEVAPNTIGLKLSTETKVLTNRSLIIHIANWKFGANWSGISDYFDLTSLFYAINNRMTKIDNVLDKHTDPILMVPSGILDEKGQVKKKALGVIEVAEGEDQKPEYIVWDASLDNAFKQIEKLVEFMYMIGEVSPDVLGMGKGMSDSGRALKFKLMRTIAKTARKKLYYDRAIKEMIYTAQLLAKEYKLEVGGKTLKGEPVIPEIQWADGLPVDETEQMNNETTAVDSGLTTRKEAIKRIYGVDDETAEQIVKDSDKEMSVKMPKIGNIFGDNQDNNPDNNPDNNQNNNE